MLYLILMLEVGEGSHHAPLTITPTVINGRNLAVQFIRWSAYLGPFSVSLSLSPLSPVLTHISDTRCLGWLGFKIKHLAAHLLHAALGIVGQMRNLQFMCPPQRSALSPESGLSIDHFKSAPPFLFLFLSPESLPFCFLLLFFFSSLTSLVIMIDKFFPQESLSST